MRLSSLPQIPENTDKKFVRIQSGVFGRMESVSREVYVIFENILPEISVPFDLRYFGLNDSHFSNFNIFGFSGNFRKTFSYHLPPFLNFEWKALLETGLSRYKQPVPS